MRRIGSICKEMVREDWGNGGIFKAGGAPAAQEQAISVPAATWPPVARPAVRLSARVIAGPLAALIVAVLPSVAIAQRSNSAAPSLASRLAAIASQEDDRGLSGTAAITAGLTDQSPVIRATAVRALGRQQSLEQLELIAQSLNDREHSVRLEAINAIAQAAQGLRSMGPGSSTTPAQSEQLRVRRRAGEVRVMQLLTRAMPGLPLSGRESASTGGMFARSLGRIPFSDSALARSAESAIVSLLGAENGGISRTTASPLAEGVLHGLYSLARARRVSGLPAQAAVDAMRSGLGYRTGDVEAAARVRRLALLSLAAAGAVVPADLSAASKDPDEQVRRLVVTYQNAIPDTSARISIISDALQDQSWLVRHEAVRAWRPLVPSRGCAPLIRSTSDAVPHVALAAIDGLSSACAGDDGATQTLLNLIDANRSDSPARARGHGGWHVHAHALVALARTAPDRAAEIVRRDARSSLWSIRVYAMRAAVVLRDSATLIQGASDANGNVREAALSGLASVVGHGADDTYASALSSNDYHVVLAAATALRGATPQQRDPLVSALLDALDRITAERRETSRDPRMALLERIAEQGDARYVQRLQPYLADFDSSVAARAAEILSPWMGRPVRSQPRLLQRPIEELTPLLAGGWRARITMSRESGGGTFEVQLFARETPYTAARFVRLARAGFYNGLTFHRVEPGFVIQGGSPSATEYVGDGPFLRDELGTKSHTRGTLGISTRGRDTGDAQIFVNLADNFRLDHDYTVFGEIVRGRQVAERVLEADVIERIEIIRVN